MAKCRVDCKFYRPTALFELCVAEESQYTADGKSDFHTVGHMRDPRGDCGPDAKLYRRATT